MKKFIVIPIFVMMFSTSLVFADSVYLKDLKDVDYNEMLGKKTLYGETYYKVSVDDAKEVIDEVPNAKSRL